MAKQSKRSAITRQPVTSPLTAAAFGTLLLLGGPAVAQERVQMQLAQSGNVAAAELATQRSLLSNLSASVAAIEQRNAELEAEVKRLQGELAEANRRIAVSSEGSQAEIERLKTQIAERDSELASARAAVETAKQDVAAARADLAIRNQSIVQMDQSLTALRKELAEKDARIETLEKSLAAREAELATATAALAKHAADLEQLRKVNADQQAQLQASRQEVAARDRTLQERDKALAASGQSLEATRSELAAREQRVKELETALAAARDEATSNAARAEQMQGERDRMQAERDQVQAELENLRTEVAERERLRTEQERQIRIVHTMPPPPSEIPFPMLRKDAYTAMLSNLDPGAGAEVVDDRFIVPGDTLFERGSDLFSEAGLRHMRRIAETLKDKTSTFPRSADWVLRIDAHTDVESPGNRFASKQELTTARAQAVVKFLADQGLSRDRMVDTGYADNHPLDTRVSRDALQRNRRVELRLDLR